MDDRRQWFRRARAGGALVLGAAVVVAGSWTTSLVAQAGRDVGRLNPKAPPETAQFGRLAGEWDCTIRSMNPDGRTFTESSARWTFYYILDGWAIQDDWVSQSPGGGTFHGTNIRSFNPRTAKWDNRWLPAGTLRWTYFEAEQVGDTMVMTGGEGTDARGAFVDRNTFHDITPDSFRWRKDRSYDDGATWIEGVSTIEATRVR